MAIDPVSLAITAAMMAAQMAMTASQRIKGARLDDTNATLSEYGTPIPRFWGIRRFQGQVIHAENLREQKQTSKTKGGKYEEYKYFGTWAALIVDHQIDAVSRIWMDKHLVYDVTGAGPVSVASAVAAFVGGDDSAIKLSSENMRIYLGTADQDPDPRYEAWCEDRYGPASAPAYRRSAYIFFEEIPLEKFGNRIPQITIEAISSKIDAYPVEVKTTSVQVITTLRFSSDYSRFISLSAAGTGFELWDTATRQLIVAGDLPFDPYGVDIADNGVIWGVEAGNTLHSVNSDGFGSFGAGIALPKLGAYPVCVGDQVYVLPYGFIQSWIMQLVGVEVVATAALFAPVDYIADEAGNHWAVGRASTTVGLKCVHGARAGDGGTFTSPSGSAASAFGVYSGYNEFVIGQDGNLCRVDPTTFAVIASANVGATPSEEEWRALRPGATSLWAGNKEISLQDLTVIRTISLSNWGIASYEETLYDPVNHALIVDKAGDANRHHVFLDRVDSAGVTLADVVNDVCEWCGIVGQDTSALTQPVAGYSGTQGAGKDWIGPLLDIHDVVPRPHDFSLQFVVLGAMPAATLLTEDFTRDGDSPRYTVTIAQDTDLPRRITTSFADAAADQQTNTAISQRPLDAMGSSREESIDLTTYVASADDAQQWSDRRFRRIWNERERTRLALTLQELALEPGDVRTLSLDGETRPARLDKMTIGRTAIKCEWVRSEPSLHALNGRDGAEMEGRDPEVIYIPSQTKGFALDIPLVEDADNDVNPVIYLAAGPYTVAWPGATAWRGDDGTYDDTVAMIDSAARVVWGYATAALAEANPNLWDRGNSINAKVFGAMPDSTTEASIDADPALNLVALGADGRWELLQYATRTLEADGSYTLSGLKRGRRGTEGNVGNHEAGDELVVVAAALPVELGADSIGDSLSFKVQSVGRSVDAAPAIDLIYSAASLKPYAPAHFRAARDDATGDWAFTWTRRARVGGAWVGGTSIPLAENSEAYELVIPIPGGGSRTIAASSPTATWTAAHQTADYGAAQTSLPGGIAVHQMSDTAGRGFASDVPLAA